MEAANAIEKTISVLKKSHSKAAQTILIHALAVPDYEIQYQAARILLHNSSPIGKTEIIRNINQLPSEILDEIHQQPDLIRFPLHECLAHGNTELILRAMETIKAAQLFSELPILLQFLRKSAAELSLQAEHIFEDLVDILYDEQDLGEPSQAALNQTTTEALLNAIGKELDQFQRLARPRQLIESLLILSHPGQSIPRQLMRENSPESLSIVWDILATGRHPGILYFLTDSLKQKYIHAKVLSIISEREDVEFQLHFIDTTPEHPTNFQEKNYLRLKPPTWLRTEPDFWDSIPEHLQGNLSRLTNLLGLSEKKKIEFIESALQFGSVEARRVCSEFRNYLKPERYEQFVRESLETSDPGIEAWAVSELKHTKLPEKSRLLIECLDSPYEEVQQQARESLDSFDLQHAIEHCESAPLAAGKKIAELLLKINPNACQELSRELASPIRTRRLRAAKAARVMGLQQEVQEGLTEMLYDSDPIIRRTIVEILAEAPSPQIVSSLQMLLDDPNPRVRATTQKSLDQIKEKTPEIFTSESPY